MIIHNYYRLNIAGFPFQAFTNWSINILFFIAFYDISISIISSIKKKKSEVQGK
jgi:hypothetical protein